MDIDFLEEIRELISRYGLEEDPEHVIVPFTGKDGRVKRCFLLKRRFMRLIYPEGHYIDYPLTEVIEATVRHPEIPLSEALDLLRRESEALRSGSEVEEENPGNL